MAANDLSPAQAIDRVSQTNSASSGKFNHRGGIGKNKKIKPNAVKQREKWLKPAEHKKQRNDEQDNRGNMAFFFYI